MENTILNNSININITHDYWDCECCGGISDSQLEVFFPTGLYLHGHDDGHFGYSTWSGDISTAYTWILETLGICVIFDGKLIHEPCYDGYDELENPMVKSLFMGPLRPLYINKIVETIHIDGDKPYFYTIDKGVTFSLYEGKTLSFYNENGIEEDQWNGFYEDFIASYYKIALTEQEEYNDFEEDEEDYDYEGDIN